MLAVVGLTLLIGLVSGGIYVWQRYTRGVIAIQRDIQKMISLEHTAWETADDVTFSATLDPQADAGWKRYMERIFQYGRRMGSQALLFQEGQVEQIDLHGNTALAQVLIPAPVSGGTAYQELRFYRNTGDQWLRTAPDPEWWGRATEEAKTTHFHFVYHPRDRAAVQGTAAGIEAFYAHLISDLGVEDRVKAPLVIEIEPRTNLMTYRPTGGSLTVPAPGLLPTPVGTSPGVALKQTVARAIAQEVMRNAGGEHWLNRQSLALADGISRWESWNWAGGIPPWNEAGQLADLREARKKGDLPPLDNLTISWTARGGRFMSQAEVTLLADYIAKAYGRERFAGVLKAWPEYASWREIAPAVLGVSFDEFETGWLAYLDQVLELLPSTARR
jgi:hypothetical protein